MANQSLDSLFSALADPTRRAVVERLAQGPAPVGELAAAHAMALPSFLKHIDILERHRLIRSSKPGRQRICRLDPAALSPLRGWLDAQRRIWEARHDRLEALLDTLPGDPSGPDPTKE